MGAVVEDPASKADVKRAFVDTHAPQPQEPAHRDGSTITGPGRGCDSDDARPIGCCQSFKRMACAPSTRMQKVLCAMFWVAVFMVSVILFAIIFPRFVDRVVNPFIRILQEKLTPLQIAGVIFAAMVILPFTLVITVIPFVWVAGIVFTFPLALTIVMAGSAVGMSLQYWLARYVFHDRVERFVNNSPKRHGLSVTLRAVELAGPWKVVALLRLGPFPYHLLNYVLGICPSIKYPVYIICSVICELLPRSLQAFFGRSLQTLADLFRGKATNPGIAAYNLAVLLLGVIFVILSVIISKKYLRKLEEEELQKEAAAAAAADLEANIGQGDQGDLAAAEGDLDQTSDMYSEQVQGKLAAAAPAAAASSEGPQRSANSPDGDMQILVDDSSSASSSSGSARAAHRTYSTASTSSSMIAVGHLPQTASCSSGLSKMDSRLSRMDSQASTSSFAVSVAEAKY